MCIRDRLCTGCEICGARCPNNIDSGEVMDALKETAILRNTISQEKIHLFNTIFLKNVKSSGRVNEGMMMARYKLKAPDFCLLYTSQELPFTKK